MARIGGNALCHLMLRASAKNAIGERAQSPVEYMAINGWLDLLSQNNSRETMLTQMAEATHVFLCDYVVIEKSIRDLVFSDASGKQYDIQYIDDPMGRHRHLEIYLKYAGD